MQQVVSYLQYNGRTYCMYKPVARFSAHLCNHNNPVSQSVSQSINKWMTEWMNEWIKQTIIYSANE